MMMYQGGKQEQQKVARKILKRLKNTRKLSEDQIQSQSGYSPLHENTGTRTDQLVVKLKENGILPKPGPQTQRSI
jgi:hypothetical protein